jgi:hypothetical protein
MPKIKIENDLKNLDDIIINNDHTFFDYDTVRLNLDDYFEKGFFYRGPKWNNEHLPKDITIIKKIEPFNNFFRIEIQNVTYPHEGYILLDLKNNKIVEAGRI